MAFAEPPKPLPPPQIENFAPGLTLLNPLSRRGTGPGLLVVVDDIAAGVRVDDGIPSPLMKWAEEGYTVVEITPEAWSTSSEYNAIEAAVKKLSATEKCDQKGKYGLLCYSAAFSKALAAVNQFHEVVGAVVYLDAASAGELDHSSLPLLAHIAGKAPPKTSTANNLRAYNYADQTVGFATPFQQAFSYSAEAVSHTRNLTFLKKLMHGPYFDLEMIWDEHTYYEFENRSVEHTMNTMVAEPYVNHIPTITGGIGRKDLTDFYTNHFIFSNPEGTVMELISRTVGIDRVVDEFIFKLKHNQMVDWLLPGVPPTHKDLEIPMMAVVNIRGDRLYHEHITWDQATALRQAGVLPEFLPWTGDVRQVNGHAGGKQNVNGHRSAELQLPVAGSDAVAKMRDKNSIPSNGMFKYGTRLVEER